MKEFIVAHNIYLTQRNNVDTLDKDRKKEPSNQCMIASFGMWAIQFGKFANLEKWNREFNDLTIEEVLHAIIMSKVNGINSLLDKQIEIIKIHDPKNLKSIKNLESQKTSRFTSIHFMNFFNDILKTYGYKLVSEKATIEKIIKVLDSGQSIVCGTNITKLKGASGHIQNFIGYRLGDKSECLGLYSNDPYGNYETLYKDHKGDKVFYSAKTVYGLLSPCSPGDARLMIYAVKV